MRACVRLDARAQHLMFQEHSRKPMTICLRYAFDQSEAEHMLHEAFSTLDSNIRRLIYK